MNRLFSYLAVLAIIAGLAFVHFSLVQARENSAPVRLVPAQGSDTPTPTNTPTPTQRPPATASMNRSSGAVDTNLLINGQNFNPGQSVNITFGGQQLATPTADGNGSFSISVDVPPLGAGRYDIRAGNVFVGTFTITSSFSVSPSSGPLGTNVQVLGTGFGPGATVTLTIDGMTWQTLTADGDGALRGNVQIPQVSGGPKVITVSGGGGGSTSANFEVTPTVTIEQTTAAPGTTVNVNGTGFRPNESGISIRLDSTTVASGISADPQGRWNGSFTVPTTTAGNHTVRVSASQTTSNIPTVQLTVGAGFSLDPPSGPPGTVVKLTGSGARANELISIDIGSGLATEQVSADGRGSWTHDLTIPAAPRGRLTIRISNALGTPVENSFNVVPTITLSSPTGSPGNSISVQGQGFTPNQSGISISFDGDIVASASANGQGSWSVDFTVPPSPKGTYPVKVSGVSPELQRPFTVGPGISLNKGQAGPEETLTVSGSGFVPNETGITVKLGELVVASGIAANSDGSWNKSLLVPQLPGGSYAVTAFGSSTSTGSVREQVLNVATNITLSATSGSPGTTITVTGRGFAANEQGISVSYDGTAVVSGIAADPKGAFTTSLVVPPSPAGLHSIQVSGSLPGAVGGTDISFQVNPDVTLTRSSGSPGATLLLTGQGFGANEQNIEIVYDNETVLSGISADANGSFEASFLVPPSPAGNHTIKVSGPVSTVNAQPQERFTVAPVVILSETEGHVGMDVSLSGRGFNPSANITLTFDDLTEATVTSNQAGSFNVEFTVPKAEGGEHEIRVLDESGALVESTFEIEDVPPAAPSLRAPSNQSSGGLFGGFRPVTRWLDVEDPSGVTYTVQVASDPDFFNVVLEQNGLSGATYALTETEALPRGKYYWRVKAVDGAGNESPYSSVFQMSSGIIPVWALMAAVVLGLLASGGGAYAYYTRVYRPRKLAQEAPAFPEFVRISRPEIGAPASQAPTGPASSAPALSAPRRALPSPFRTGGGGRGRGPRLSPEEQARLQMVVDFVRSIPLLEVSPDLTWLEELIESLGSTAQDVYEQVLRGDIEPVYQPPWMQHPTYQDLQVLEPAQPFLQSLEEYIELVNDCASDTLAILRKIYNDLDTGGSLDAMGEKHWRFILTVALSSLAWFRGTYLGQPSAREYVIKADPASETGALSSLHGVEKSPFSGPLLEELSQDDLVFFRDLHVQMRNTYRTDEDARALAAKMTATSAMREQLMQGIAQLGEQAQAQAR